MTQADETPSGVPQPLSDAAPGSQPAPDHGSGDRHDTSASTDADPSREERIRRAAYERFEQRNGAPGDPVADWLAAEAEVADEDR